jgi:FO synthase subunit 1
VHRHAPSKAPQLRLQQLAQAGQLKIPFTTGILLGIGETSGRATGNPARRSPASHRRWGHIQEVILQPHQPGQHQAQAFPAYASQALLGVIAEARQLLPADIVIQVPPNLINEEAALAQALTCGARDLGGLGPIDEVNPDYPHPSAARLREQLKNLGWELHPRLPIYPRYDSWLSPSLRLQVDRWRSQLAPVEAPRPATA